MNTIGSHSWHPTEEEREDVQARISVSSHRKEAKDRRWKGYTTHAFRKVPGLDAAGSTLRLVLEVGRGLALSGKLSRGWWGSVVGTSEKPGTNNTHMSQFTDRARQDQTVAIVDNLSEAILTCWRFRVRSRFH